MGRKEESMSVVHRMAMRGGAQCGAGPDKFGHLKLSVTGAPSAVTCPDCTERPKATREAALEAISAAAAKFRDES
jgi:hypothetical protein